MLMKMLFILDIGSNPSLFPIRIYDDICIGKIAAQICW